ncbi:hypothetical protein [Massilia sp. H6]|uniref:hypothetical protein n=1 Tax=Massilia sp. H6 TaxID=2970464 RepID=UPI002168BA35|nr:hypothetical protein [Massilia sp. H6]UVW29229.1 hypothetical protein NRS07_03520 [Massilia sp. H6]
MNAPQSTNFPAPVSIHAHRAPDPAPIEEPAPQPFDMPQPHHPPGHGHTPSNEDPVPDPKPSVLC